MEYKEYLNTTKWKEKAFRCKKRADFKCEKCGSNKNLNAHHLTYKNIGNEKNEDLQCLCFVCYSKKHEHLKLGNFNTKKQDWIAMYKNGYDEVMMNLKSDLEKNMFIDIRDKFTKNKTTISINQTKFAERHSITKSTVNRFIKKMRDIEFLYKTDDGYMMNPFVIVPYQADELTLQSEWTQLTK